MMEVGIEEKLNWGGANLAQVDLFLHVTCVSKVDA